MENDNTIQMKDNRLVRPMVFIEKFNPTGKRYVIIQQAATLNVDSCEIAFPMPNPISLFISISRKEHNLAKTIYTDLIKPHLNPEKTFKIEDNILSKFLDYLEHIQTSIITIYSAVEALSNLAIPDDFTLSKTRKGVQEIWTKKEIDRWSSTTEKIGVIVPDILNIPSPKKMLFWENFKKLELIRNEIIHQKHSAFNPKDIEDKFLAILLSENVFKYVKSGLELITYFCEHNKSDTFFPVISGAYPIEPTEVDDWDRYFTWRPFKNP